MSNSSPNSEVSVGDIRLSNTNPLVLISGPCQLESRDHALMVAESLRDICASSGIDLIYKSSFDKANRTSATSARGVGIDDSLAIFDEIRNELGLPVLTDIHLPEQAEIIAPHVDILQIPAFLCRQTDLLVAAAKTGKVVNTKKGQFLAPWDMGNVIQKIVGSGNPNVLLTERGTSFGYNTLVSDFRSLPIMSDLGAPVIFDATHSVQRPGGLGSSSGGERRFVATLSYAAVSVGVSALFIESHDSPDDAPSDGPNMIALSDLGSLLERVKKLDVVAKGL